jgi:hypothetical protein
MAYPQEVGFLPSKVWHTSRGRKKPELSFLEYISIYRA